MLKLFLTELYWTIWISQFSSRKIGSKREETTLNQNLLLLNFITLERWTGGALFFRGQSKVWITIDVVIFVINGVAIFIMFVCKVTIWNRFQSKFPILKHIVGCFPTCFSMSIGKSYFEPSIKSPRIFCDQHYGQYPESRKPISRGS